MSPTLLRWTPTALLALGVVATTWGVAGQTRPPLRASLAAAIPMDIAGRSGRDASLEPGQLQSVAVSSYLLRQFERSGDPASWVSLYVGYYDHQTQGRTIHSPKNCLPGAGWEILARGTAAIPTASGTVTVNRFVLSHRGQRALVLYWYQGRGRVAANEYWVKWHLLRDAALRRRSDEALVRIIAPITAAGEAAAFALARSTAQRVIPALERALPL